MLSPDDTIVALATAPGRGGLAVVRLSGSRAVAIAAAMTGAAAAAAPRTATLARIVVPGSEQGIDEAVVTVFPGPHSYTGEDVVELSLHGSPLLVAEVIEGVTALGARLAGPGEFTLRAFLGGRLDLTRAEAVRDLVEATTPAQARMAYDQLQGGLAERLGEIEAALFELSARLAASGDFPEEGYHFITPEEVVTAVRAAAGRVEALLEDARRGRLLREGVTVAIVGSANVGKSTLFNRLAGAERAIVTAVPGTTRDLITEAVMLLGTRMTLVDTAGMRATSDPIEREGVARAERAGAAADVVVVLLDATRRMDEDDERVLAATRARPRVVAVNKWDARLGGGLADLGPAAAGGIEVSALTGEGIDRLVREIHAAAGLSGAAEPPAVSNVRHITLLKRVGESLRRAEAAASHEVGHMPEEILLSDLQEAREALEEVTGRRSSDALLDEIFAHFCVGK